MRINRYRWTPKGMVYDPNGEWVAGAAHEAVVSVKDADRLQMIVANNTQVASLEDGVDAKENELNVAKKRIEDLEKMVPATPVDPIRETKP